jgi:hypothetical protein
MIFTGMAAVTGTLCSKFYFAKFLNKILNLMPDPKFLRVVIQYQLSFLMCETARGDVICHCLYSPRPNYDEPHPPHHSPFAGTKQHDLVHWPLYTLKSSRTFQK